MPELDPEEHERMARGALALAGFGFSANNLALAARALTECGYTVRSA